MNMLAARRLRSISGSKAHSSRPFSGSRAMTRLNGVLKIRRPSTTSGVASNAVPRLTKSGSSPPSYTSPCR
jgi:hypothetical protein